MARSDAPFLSLGASGTFAKTLTAASWKGRPYLRRRVIPANPKSALQVSIRAMMKFLAQQWASIAAVDQATWEDLAAAGSYSPFNAYVSQNQSSWRSFATPTQAYPAAGTGTVGATPAHAATGGIRQATIQLAVATANDNWGALIFRSTTTGFTPAIDNVIAAILLDDTATHTYVDSPLAPDTYYYNSFLFTNDGVVGSALGEDSAVVT